MSSTGYLAPDGKVYKQRVGTPVQVLGKRSPGTNKRSSPKAYQTSGGVTKTGLKANKNGEIVSKEKSKIGKKISKNIEGYGKFTHGLSPKQNVRQVKAFNAGKPWSEDKLEKERELHAKAKLAKVKQTENVKFRVKRGKGSFDDDEDSDF
jgi:hypothetical protein